MRKTFFTFYCALASMNLFAQNAQIKGDTTKNKIRTAADLTSGNSQDVLTSFFQLALNDIDNSNDHSFKFQSSLFAIKAKTDSTIWNSPEYLKQQFSRNLVIGFAVNLDSNYKFQGYSVNAKYAIINHRDKTATKFILDYEEEWNQIQYNAQMDYLETTPKPSVEDQLKAIRFFNDRNNKDRTKDSTLLPSGYYSILRKEINEHDYFKNWNLEKFRNLLEDEYDYIANAVENKSLLTIETNLYTNANGNNSIDNTLLSKYNLNAEYLKGFINAKSKMNLELDIKGALDLYSDTTISMKSLNRTVISGSLGFNWIIIKDKKHKSLLEFKGDVTTSYITNGILPGEEYNPVTGNGTLKIRITDNFWVPIKVKYDPINGKVFGFLTITSNFDWLKGKN